MTKQRYNIIILFLSFSGMHYTSYLGNGFKFLWYYYIDIILLVLLVVSTVAKSCHLGFVKHVVIGPIPLANVDK